MKKTIKRSLKAFGLISCTFVIGLALAGCGTISQSGSANLTPLIEEFPLRATRPLAREYRYTYSNMWVLDGKVGKPSFAADAATRADPSARTPAAVLAAASVPTPRWSDALSKAANEQTRRGARGQHIVEMHGAAASMAAAEASLAKAQATAGAMLALLQVAEDLNKMWTQQTADELAGWIRQNTGVIGAEAPEGSRLLLDFTYMLTGKSFRTDSRSDILVKAILTDGRGGTLESSQAFQIYTYLNEPSIEIPKDAIRVDAWLLPPEKRDSVKPLYGSGVFNVHAVLAASAAISDLYRQLEAK